jgi:hypothetical protein
MLNVKVITKILFCRLIFPISEYDKTIIILPFLLKGYIFVCSKHSPRSAARSVKAIQFLELQHFESIFYLGELVVPPRLAARTTCHQGYKLAGFLPSYCLHTLGIYTLVNRDYCTHMMPTK